MRPVIEINKFGPWAIVTGASSGIGREFARQLAADKINLVLVSRSLSVLEAVGKKLEKEFGIQYRAIEIDLTAPNFIEQIDRTTNDLDIGLLVSNAGVGKSGTFLSFTENEALSIVQINALSHFHLTYYFGKRLAKRGKGGVILVAAMGVVDGIPYLANEAASKAYVTSLGKGLHKEFENLGLHMTVLETPPTDTPVLRDLGFTKDNMPVKPITPEQCVKETLHAFRTNKLTVIPGRLNRIMNATIPGSLNRKIMADMLKKNNKNIDS